MTIFFSSTTIQIASGLSDTAILLCAIIVGCLAGIITGLAPGVHINLVSAIAVSLSGTIALNFNPGYAAVAIAAMAVTHTFTDTIPSIFLGAPDDDKALGVLPGHRYLLRGNGMMAVKLCVIGGMAGTVLSAIIFIPMMQMIDWTYNYAKQALFWVMVAIVLFTIFKDRKRLLATMIFLISGLLGLVALNISLDDPLLPLLSGMFGISTLLYSINEDNRIPEQDRCDYTDLKVSRAASGTIRGIAAGFITALLPGVSASSAAAVTSQGGKLGDHGFLVLLGSLGSASFILSLAAYLSIEKARNGAMAAIIQLSPIDTRHVLILIGAVICASGIATIITLAIGKKAATILPKLPYKKLSISVIAFVFIMVLVRCGPLGCVVLVTSTAVGLLPAAFKTARSQAMGCLLLPLLVALW